MKTNNILIRIALIGLMIAISGCTMGVNALVDDMQPGVTATFGDAGGDQDHEPRNRDRAGPPDDETGPAEPGPGNSDFGRGDHPNAGGGNGGEYDDNGDEVDPGNSGDSKGKSGSQD